MASNIPKILVSGNRLLLLSLFLLIAVLCASIVIINWDFVFDDAFISFRYAQNLADGHGIVWNVGEEPTEGYTNLLLILIVAPFIAFGFDPLLVVRIVSFASLAGIVYLIYKEAVKQEDTDRTTAIMIASILLLYPASYEISLIGLETILYAFALLLSLITGSIFIQNQNTKSSITFSLTLFITSLVRPEALMLYPILFLTYIFFDREKRKPSLRPLLSGAVFITVLVALCFLWKIVYFGDILPNPFYIKASNSTFFSPIGVDTVFGFVHTYNLLASLSLFTLIIYYKYSAFSMQITERSRQIFHFGLFFVLLNLLFFSHTDTLMDIYRRFLYPLIPVMIYINIPILTRIIRFVTKQTAKFMFLAPLAFLAFVLLVSPLNIFEFSQRYTLTKRAEVIRYPYGALMHIEQKVGRTLAEFPGIKDVKIAFGDSGMIPYYSQALWLDLVGLNDSFIAKNKDIKTLLDYIFKWNPDLLIMGGLKEYKWGKGHGPLGDIQQWIVDPRFDSYRYVGTCFSNNAYDLYFFIKEPDTKNQALNTFLKEKVVDGNFEILPMAFGSHRYELKVSPKWISRGN